MTHDVPIRSWYLQQAFVDRARSGEGIVHNAVGNLPSGRVY